MTHAVKERTHRAWTARTALWFVLVFGVVNLFADMTYEGARSVTGPYLGALGVLLPLTAIAAAFAPLVFLGDFTLALIGAVLWGIALGVHESVMPAAVASLIPKQRLGAAYGVFAAGFGIAWFAGSAAVGALYDRSVIAVVVLSAAAQLLACVPILIAARKMQRS